MSCTKNGEPTQIDRLVIKKYQALFYVIEIALGVLLGATNPGLSKSLEIVLWPVLAFLLFVNFSQIPVVHIPKAIFDYKFISAALIGNFVLIPGFRI